jgi:hypothetical protein
MDSSKPGGVPIAGTGSTALRPGHLAQVDLQVEAYVAPERMESRNQVTARAGSLGPRALGQSVDEKVKQELEALVCVTIGEVIG